MGDPTIPRVNITVQVSAVKKLWDPDDEMLGIDGDQELAGENVILAMANFTKWRWTPPFASHSALGHSYLGASYQGGGTDHRAITEYFEYFIKALKGSTFHLPTTSHSLTVDLWMAKMPSLFEVIQLSEHSQTGSRKTDDVAFKKEGIMVRCGLLNDQIIGMLKRLWPYPTIS